ncbi:MAG: tetrathionate reductase family octaheme c-type cytochrome [Chloroflexota bacterium]
MRRQRYIWVFGLMGTGFIILGSILLLATPNTGQTSDPWSNVPVRSPQTDHSDLISEPFETGEEVTLRCLECHEDAAHDVMQTTHWTWQAPPVDVEWSEEPVSIGKTNTINNFCIGVQSNIAGCSRCHSGYGWVDEEFDFSQQSQVDCLVCHDQTGTYVKASGGYPAEGVDLLSVAQSVGSPTRENCGSCHFNGGGGNGVKHGDLDETLYFPSENIDVHMGRYNFQCIDCHQTEDHSISGRSISVSVDDTNQIACTDCHEPETTHDDSRITDHLNTVACQTCHIPLGALRDPTKMTWDWSTAGDPDREEDPSEYLRIKGSFIYDSGFVPEYTWYNGTAMHYLLGDPIAAEGPTMVNDPLGDISDPTAMIWPFKLHIANQPYDIVNNILLVPNTVGPQGYWTTFDWDLALQNGSEANNLPYSGEYSFTETYMYLPLTHMVQPVENVLQCTDCHSENGRMDWEALGYLGDPIQWGGRTTESDE